MLENIEYIDNDMSNGMKFDIKLIKKELKKLNIPSHVYNPFYLPLESQHLYVLLSERQLGKTTNILLLGLCFNKLYGTTIHYVRQTEKMIAPKSIQDIFSTIIKYGYIEKLTEGEYNTVVYLHRRWYLALQKDGEIVKRAENHFMFDCSIEGAFDLKSSYNCPTGDFIIFDEFISNQYGVNEFVRWCDLVKTIINNRISPYIFMVANTINRHSPYFEELEISKEIQTLVTGHMEIYKSSLGTKVAVEIINSTQHTKTIKQKVNELFFNFRNPNLSAITGADTWSTDNYPHLLDNNPEKLKETGLYISYSGRLLKLDLVYSESLQSSILYVHKATKTYDDSVILVPYFIKDSNESYLLSNKKIRKFIEHYHTRNLVRFCTNYDGAIFSSFLQRWNMEKTSI